MEFDRQLAVIMVVAAVEVLAVENLVVIGIDSMELAGNPDVLHVFYMLPIIFMTFLIYHKGLYNLQSHKNIE